MRACRRILPLLLVAALPAACSGGKGGPPGASLRPPPSLIVLISLDTLRADRLDLYGYPRETAPHLSLLARDAVVFTSVAAQATMTLISHKSLLAARDPLRILGERGSTSMEELASLEDPRPLALPAFVSSREDLPLTLGRGGYRTVGFADGAWMSRRYGFGAGFDSYHSSKEGFRRILSRATRWLREEHRPEVPSFLFVHTYDIHCPYPARRPYNEMFCADHQGHVDLQGLCGKKMDPATMAPADLQAVSDHYDGGIASADAYVGELLDELRSRGLYDESMIVVTSDHGESLGEHGYVGHGGLYLEQLMVPLIIKMPASWRAGGSRIDAPVELVDVTPTILDAAGLDLPERDAVDGVSLLPLVEGASWSRPFQTAHFAYREGPRRTINLAKRAILEPGRWLVIDDRAAGRTEAFDLERDPLGLAGTPPPLPPEAAALRIAMEARDRSLLAGAAPRAGSTAEETVETEALPPQVLEELRSLGYID